MNLQPTRLRDDLIDLVPVHAQHFEKLFAAAADPLIWAQHPTPDRYKKEVFQQFFDSALESKGAFVVVDRKSDEIIGSSRYYDFDSTAKTIVIGYTFLSRPYWGGQYNHALKKLMLDYAFEYVDSVFFHIGETNLRSQIATQRFGAKKLDRTEAKTYGERVVRNFVYELKKEAWKSLNH